MFIGEGTSLEDIKAVEVVKPDGASDRWKGIKHYDLIEGIRGQLDYRNLEIKDERYNVKDNVSLIGYFTVRPTGLPMVPGQDYMLGFRHSNDLRTPLVISIGAIISICHNGMITGEHVLRRKHTKNLDIEAELFAAIRDVSGRFSEVKETTEVLQNTELEHSEYEYLLVEGARGGAYPWSWIGKVEAEYKNPSEDNPQCEIFRGTRWGVYNAFSYVAKQLPPERQANQLYQFMQVMTN